MANNKLDAADILGAIMGMLFLIIAIGIPVITFTALFCHIGFGVAGNMEMVHFLTPVFFIGIIAMAFEALFLGALRGN